MQNLSWHRRSTTGEHFTDVTGNVEFKASVTRGMSGGWYLHTQTFGQTLTGSQHHTLAEAKAQADVVYRNVEVTV
jgi:hypothetical protein